MTGTPPRDLDLEHLANLANLPLSEDEEETLRSGCQEVLEAFQLPESDDKPDQEARDIAFEDDPHAWPEDEVEMILEQAPHVDDGRHIRG